MSGAVSIIKSSALITDEYGWERYFRLSCFHCHSHQYCQLSSIAAMRVHASLVRLTLSTYYLRFITYHLPSTTCVCVPRWGGRCNSLTVPCENCLTQTLRILITRGVGERRGGGLIFLLSRVSTFTISGFCGVVTAWEYSRRKLHFPFSGSASAGVILTLF